MNETLEMHKARKEADRSLLIIEDDTDLRDALVGLLSDAGWIVTWAINGEDALRSFRSDPANVILTDIVMPEMTGLDFIRAIREFDTDTPIVILTGYSTYDYCLEALRAGATDLLTKPFRNDDLLETLTKAYAHRHGLVPPEPSGTLIDHSLNIRIPYNDLSESRRVGTIAEVLYQIDAVCRQTGYRRRRLAVRRSLEEALLLASRLRREPPESDTESSHLDATATFDEKQCAISVRLPGDCPGDLTGLDPFTDSSDVDSPARRFYLIRSFCDECSVHDNEVRMVIYHPRYQRPLRQGA